MNKCNQCSVSYLPYAQGQDDREEVASFFICSDCFQKAWAEFEEKRIERKKLVERGVHPKMAGRIAYLE